MGVDRPEERTDADAVRPEPFEDPEAPGATDMPEVGEDDFPAQPLRQPDTAVDDGAPMPPEAAAAHEGFDRAAEAAHDELDAGLKSDPGPNRGYSGGRYGRRREPTPPVAFPRLDEPSADRQVLAIINAPMDVRTFCRVLDALGYGFPRAVVLGNEQGQAVVYAEPIEE